MWMVFLVEKAK